MTVPWIGGPGVQVLELVFQGAGDQCSDGRFCKYIVALLYVENFLYEHFMYNILKVSVVCNF
jgi:hypothetical protein